MDDNRALISDVPPAVDVSRMNPAAQHWLGMLVDALRGQFPSTYKFVYPWMEWASCFIERTDAGVRRHGPTAEDHAEVARMLQAIGWLKSIHVLVGFVSEFDRTGDVSIKAITANPDYFAAAGTRHLFRTKEKRAFVREVALRRAQEAGGGLASPDVVRRNLDIVGDEIGFPRDWRYMLELPLEPELVEMLPDPKATGPDVLAEPEPAPKVSETSDSWPRGEVSRKEQPAFFKWLLELEKAPAATTADGWRDKLAEQMDASVCIEIGSDGQILADSVEKLRRADRDRIKSLIGVGKRGRPPRTPMLDLDAEL